jgi:hypothetical protein
MHAYIALVILCGSQGGDHPQSPKYSLLLAIHGHPLDSTHIFHSYIACSTIKWQRICTGCIITMALASTSLAGILLFYDCFLLLGPSPVFILPILYIGVVLHTFQH